MNKMKKCVVCLKCSVNGPIGSKWFAMLAGLLWSNFFAMFTGRRFEMIHQNSGAYGAKIVHHIGGGLRGQNGSSC
jgi:hypothetical protein